MYYQWKVLSESLKIKSDGQEISNIGWQERDILYFCTGLVSLFSLYNKEYDINVARLFWFMAYRTRHTTVGACLFCFMACVAYYSEE